MQFLEKQQVSLLITDIQMPFLNGFEFLKAIKSIESLNQIPIVAITGSVLNDADFLTKDRFDYFLSKPYSSKQLVALFQNFHIKN